MDKESSGIEVKSIDLKIESLLSHYGLFRITPLPKGEGITIGNSLRRTLLNDIEEGIGITEVEILSSSLKNTEDTDKILHEFSAIDEVRESILEILINLKAIVFKVGNLDWYEPKYGYIRSEGPYRLTSKDIILPDKVTVVDPTQYIATTYGKGTFELKVKIEKRKKSKASELEKNRLILEDHSNPVKKVNYVVEEFVNSKNMSPNEQLKVEIWTDGSITPRETLEKSVKSLIKTFHLIEGGLSKKM